MSNIILEMKNVTMDFPGVRALDAVGFTLMKGSIHALVGENGAGKSTLMKILLGLYQATKGEVFLEGNKVEIRSPTDGLAHGISMIHQEISLVSTMTVDENIWLGREGLFRKKNGLIDLKKRREATLRLLEKLQVQLDPSAFVGALSTANMQLVEIVRAVSYDSKLIIMDEPTSALADHEIGILMRIIKSLSGQGVAIIFISHKLDELLGVCDRFTVLRDGKVVAEDNIDNVTKVDLIRMISGRDISDIYVKEETNIGKLVLEVKGLSREGVFRDISFDLREGEVLGLCGLLGAGRTEILEAIFGVAPCDGGEIIVDGVPVRINSPQTAISRGFGMVTEDRLRKGIIHKLPVRHNLSLANIRAFSRRGFLMMNTEKNLCNQAIDDFNIRLASIEQLVNSLSGGNQQKVLIGRSLMTNPRVLLLDEPTRGIDVGSKHEVYKAISGLAKKGLAIIMVSSELPEVMGMSDRIIVISRGRVTATVNREDFSQESLMAAAYKGYEQDAV